MLCAAGAPCPRPVPPRSLWKRAEPGCVPGRRGRAIPCPYNFPGSSLDRIRIRGCGSMGSWPGPGATGGHRGQARGAPPPPNPKGTMCKPRNFKPKKKKKPPKKLFANALPGRFQVIWWKWLTGTMAWVRIPGVPGAPGTAPRHQRRHRGLSLPLGWRWPCPFPPSLPFPGQGTRSSLRFSTCEYCIQFRTNSFL